MQLKKLVLQRLAHTLDETIDEMVIRESVNTITSLLNIWELNRGVNIILIEIINIMPNLDIKILNQVKKLYNKYLVTKSLVKIVNTTPNIAPKAFNALQELFNDPIENFMFEAVLVWVEIVKAKPSLVKAALNILKTLIRNANYVKFDTVQYLKSESLFGNPNNEIIYQATRSLTEMLSVMHEQEALNTLQDLLNDSNIYIKLRLWLF